MKPTLPLLLLLLLTACQTTRTVTLVGLTDYHSHAVPFVSEGEPGQGGVARTLAYLKAAKARPDTLVVSGGDTLNQGIPTWSDEYGCVEWPWFNGLVEVMALGNHDLDYGAEAFEECRRGIQYPILSANLVREDGAPYFQEEGRPYVVREVGGVRLGFFAVAGPDMQRLVKREHLPEGTRWTEARAAAREVVKALRERERVHAVVFIGHQLREDDEALAREVQGIDVIMGSHSHYRGELRVIPGTRTHYVSPYQYLAYLSEVRLHFREGRLERVTGGLVKMDASRPEDAEVAARVAELQEKLEARRPERFEVLGRTRRALSDVGLSEGPAPIGRWVTEAVRAAVGAHVFFTTASSIRAGLPEGEVTVEAFYAAIPYRNRVALAEVSGAQLAEWVELSESKRGSDGYSQQSGLRYELKGGQLQGLQVLRNPARPEEGYAPVDPRGTYRLATTDFQANVAADYREAFEKAGSATRTEVEVHEVLIEELKSTP